MRGEEWELTAEAQAWEAGKGGAGGAPFQGPGAADAHRTAAAQVGAGDGAGECEAEEAIYHPQMLGWEEEQQRRRRAILAPMPHAPRLPATRHGMQEHQQQPAQSSEPRALPVQTHWN